jgi:hypothetical protein
VWLVLQQRNEREVSCTWKWAQTQRNPESKECGREWVGEVLNGCSTPSPRPLFIELGQETFVGARQQRLVGIGERWGPMAVGLGRPTQGFNQNPGGPPGWQPGPTCSPMVIFFYAQVLVQNLLREGIQIIFQRIFMLKNKYFLGFL